MPNKSTTTDDPLAHVKQTCLKNACEKTSSDTFHCPLHTKVTVDHHCNMFTVRDSHLMVRVDRQNFRAACDGSWHKDNGTFTCK